MTCQPQLPNPWARSAAALVAVAAVAALAPIPLAAQQLPPCSGIVFSTEEDFIARAGESADGNPIVSDGDLLTVSPGGGGAAVCARNRDLLRVFEVRADLGLDAADVVDAEGFLIAFSTELDHPRGAFTAGDLLFTTGGVLPNAALLAAFDLQVPRDMGLDAVHLIGDPDGLKRLVEAVGTQPRDAWIENPGGFSKLLQETGTDVWFSTEGTELPLTSPAFLDGDLLSAKNGIIVARNSLLLPPPVPAGIPDRGVDFGLDAVTGSRKEDRESIHYSTEILYRGEKPTFTDGDVLRLGNGVVIPHEKLVNPFEPKADFLGLDALHFRAEEPLREPNLQSLCGRGYPDLDFDGGRVAVNGGGTGLYRDGLGGGTPVPPRRPCGEFAAFDGFLPAAGVDRFRVAFRKAGAAAPAPGTASGIETAWKVKTFQFFPFPGCYYNTVLATDPDGWMDASDFLAARDGFPCTNPAMQLAVWNTPALGNPDKDAHFVVWLEWDDGSALHREAVEHHVQLDNTLPVITPFPNGLQVRLPGGGANDLVPACGEAPEGTSKFEVWGQFADDYYWNFRLRLKGGLPPAAVNYGPHAYYDATDGPPGLKNTDDTGTKPAPPPGLQHLRDIDMTDLGASFQDCCYVLDLWVRDAAIRHSFNQKVVNDVSGSSTFQANAFVTFAASP